MNNFKIKQSLDNLIAHQFTFYSTGDIRIWNYMQSNHTKKGWWRSGTNSKSTGHGLVKQFQTTTSLQHCLTVSVQSAFLKEHHDAPNAGWCFVNGDGVGRECFVDGKIQIRIAFITSTKATEPRHRQQLFSNTIILRLSFEDLFIIYLSATYKMTSGQLNIVDHLNIEDLKMRIKSFK